MFDKKKHVIRPNEVPYENIIKWDIGVDYGTANPTVFLLIGKDIEGNLYVCKEYYYDSRAEAEIQGNADVQKTDEEYTSDLREFITDLYELTGKTYREIPIIIDPSAASFKLNVRRFHMRTKNANNEVLDGIRTVSTLLGQNKLFISEECENLISEMFTYAWDEKKQMKG